MLHGILWAGPERAGAGVRVDEGQARGSRADGVQADQQPEVLFKRLDPGRPAAHPKVSLVSPSDPIVSPTLRIATYPLVEMLDRFVPNPKLTLINICVNLLPKIPQ